MLPRRPIVTRASADATRALPRGAKPATFAGAHRLRQIVNPPQRLNAAENMNYDALQYRAVMQANALPPEYHPFWNPRGRPVAKGPANMPAAEAVPTITAPLLARPLPSRIRDAMLSRRQAPSAPR